MGQEYFINDQTLQDKVRELLPSQGGAGAGFDLSASTQIVPIIDLTESAEGSNFRQDLQSALSFKSVTAFDVINTTTTIINNTGYYRVFGAITAFSSNPLRSAQFALNDGVTDKVIYQIEPGFNDANNDFAVSNFDFIVFLESGDSLKAISGGTAMNMVGCTRQLASIDGTLTNP